MRSWAAQRGRRRATVHMFLPDHYQQKAASTVLLPNSSNQIISLFWPAEGGRARRVVTRSRCRSTRKYPSLKAGPMVQAESPHERNAFVLLDACPAVTAFREQPVVIRFALDGVEHRHYPDILVTFADDSREFWEIKPRRDAEDERVSARTRLMTAGLPRFGFRYRMVLAEDLSRQPRLGLAQDLLRHGKCAIDDVSRERIRKAFRAAPVIRWQSALKGDLGPHGRSALCRLVLEGVVSCGAASRLTSETQFTWVMSKSRISFSN